MNCFLNYPPVLGHIYFNIVTEKIRYLVFTCFQTIPLFNFRTPPTQIRFATVVAVFQSLEK